MKATEEHTEAQENKDIVERIKEVLGNEYTKKMGKQCLYKFHESHIYFNANFINVHLIYFICK